MPSTSSNNSERPSFGLTFVRYGIGVAMVIAGFVMIGVNPEMAR